METFAKTEINEEAHVKLKRKWRVLMLVAVLGVVGVGVYFALREREPEYAGKPVSYWFRLIYGPAGLPTADIMRKLGTNALPYLVKQALSTAKDTALRTNFYALLAKLPDSWHLPEFVSHDNLREMAVRCINEINPPAEVILPFVKDALNSENPLRRHKALQILSNVETNAAMLAPYFGKALHVKDHDKDLDSRAVAVSALCRLGTNAEPALPDLIWLLTTQGYIDVPIVDFAKCFGNLGTNAAAAVPKLRIAFVEVSNWVHRCEIAAALCRIDGGQTEALQFLIDGLKQPDELPKRTILRYGESVLAIYEPEPEQRASYAAWQIGVIGQNARAAIPALVGVIDGTNYGLKTYAPYALFKVGAPRELYFNKVKAGLRSADEFGPMSAASLILWMDPYDAESREVMANLVRTHSRLERAALRTLIELPGPLDDDIKEAVNRVLVSGDDLWVHLVKDSLERRDQRH